MCRESFRVVFFVNFARFSQFSARPLGALIRYLILVIGPFCKATILKCRVVVLVYILSCASEAGSPTNHLGSRPGIL